MKTWYNAQESMIEVANAAMAEIARSNRGAEAIAELIRKIWEPTALALVESIPEDFERDYPEESAAALCAGSDFVGMTSDTRRLVLWGADRGGYREFVFA